MRTTPLSDSQLVSPTGSHRSVANRAEVGTDQHDVRAPEETPAAAANEPVLHAVEPIGRASHGPAGGGQSEESAHGNGANRAGMSPAESLRQPAQLFDGAQWAVVYQHLAWMRAHVDRLVDENTGLRQQVLQRDVLKPAVMGLVAAIDHLDGQHRRAAAERAQSCEISQQLALDYVRRACGAAAARLQGALEQYGVSEIHVLPGVPLDPALHRVVEKRKASDLADAGKVVRVIARGWTEPGRVVRAAGVEVWVCK